MDETKVSKIEGNFPYDIEDVEPSLAAELMKYFPGERTKFVQVGPKKYCFPYKYREQSHELYNLKLQSSDVFIVTYPRTGTTMTQELIWMVAHDMDYGTADSIPLVERFPYLEYSMLMHPFFIEKCAELATTEKDKKYLEIISRSSSEALASIPSPRFIKTHMPLSLLPPYLLDTAKVVYVARDPRDTVVSYYYLRKSMGDYGYTGDFKTFFNYFIKDLCTYSPFFEHLKEAWQLRDHPNMLFLFYEELIKDLPAVVRRVAEFFGKSYTDEEVSRLCERLNIENFKKNPSIKENHLESVPIYNTTEQTLVRKGKSGGWRQYFDEDMTRQVDAWMAQNLSDTDFCLSHWNN